MKLCALISCMHQYDHSIIERSNVQCDCVVVNQCDCDNIEDYDFVNKYGEIRHVRFINTRDRGLSRSRNMAIANAPNDAVCLICDDDEVLEDNCESIICDTYEDNPESAVILFSLNRLDCDKKYPPNPSKVNFKQILQSNSIQISLKKSSFIGSNITFDVKMGSGTGNGGGEENKFLFDCRKQKLSINYSPKTIASVLPNESCWFNGYNETYFTNSGWTSRRILGNIIGLLYVFYTAVSKRPLYKDRHSFFKVFKWLIAGYVSKR